MKRLQLPRPGFGVLATLLMLGGCRSSEIRDPEYTDILDSVASIDVDSGWDNRSLAPVMPDLAGPHPVEDYITVALSQNPQIQAARKRVEALAHRVPQAASLEDPMLGVMGFPFHPNVPQTASGRATAGVTASQKVPWFGKLQTAAEAAEAEVDSGRAELAAAELEVIEQVKLAYYQLYYIQQATGITEENRELLGQFEQIARVKYEVERSVSQQDVLRAQVELSNLDRELIRLEQELLSAQADLAQVLHISPETELRAVTELPREQAPRDIQRLYELAVASRPELHAQLAEIERDHRLVELAQLQYFPDLTLSVDWREMSTSGSISPVADGIDDVGLGLTINVPIYRKRLDAGVREAEARAVSDARQYDALRDRTLKGVKDLFARVRSQERLVRLFRDDIIPKSDQTLQVSIPDYQVGRIDFLQLIDNWQQLLRFRITLYELEAQLRQSLASLERVVGGEALEEQMGEQTPENPESGNPPPSAPADVDAQREPPLRTLDSPRGED
jgi:outer membrane protein TolC